MGSVVDHLVAEGGEAESRSALGKPAEEVVRIAWEYRLQHDGAVWCRSSLSIRRLEGESGMLWNQARSYLLEQLSGRAKWRFATLVLLVLFGAISLFACTSSEEGTRKNTFSVGSNPAVKVRVDSGDVTLVVGTAGEFAVTAELQKPESVEYQVSQDGDSITVDAKTKSDSRADVTVTLPDNTEFELSTGSGNVDVAGVQASGQVSTGSGSVTLEKTRGDVAGNTGSGDVTLSGVSGSFNINTGSGNITLRGSTGSFSLSSGNGNIDASESKGGFSVSTGNGDVEFQGELARDSDNRLSSGNGSVTAELTGSPSVELDLEIEQGGKVRVDLPVTVREEAERKLVGTVDSGEAALTVRVGKGDITVK